jgi:hypothetical protein
LFLGLIEEAATAKVLSPKAKREERKDKRKPAVPRTNCARRTLLSKLVIGLVKQEA